ncbi:Neurotactin [Fasciola gigantica]|uniref:Neurotactin n=1 Tax=Fasciola gigantica TaxID=46835 RepID=A0A504YI92_FASGI|nr:Neurotactin [Fasciola gigantica]
MSGETIVNITFKTIKPPESFFDIGRPLVDPHRPRLYLQRRFDFLLLLGIALSFVALVAHLFLVVIQLPEVPPATSYVISQCASMDGEWNQEKNVLRYWAVPYAVPPIIEADTSFPEVMHDIAEKYGIPRGGFRWHRTFTVPDTEYCFLSFDDRCKFADGRWNCRMRHLNRTAACVELDEAGEIIGNATEHCLTLDISMPVFKGTLLPVIVVFTGFRSLRSPMSGRKRNEPAYLPTDEAVLRFGAIWINARYRLGPFGSFYDFSRIGLTEKETHYMNFALRDQLAVLTWVQHNVGRFGGDASKVVLLAHGSGATGALALVQLQSRLNYSVPWFRSVWIASGALNWYDEKRASWQELIPYKIFTSLASCPWGLQKKVLHSNSPCAVTLRDKFMKMDLHTLTRIFKKQYEDWSAGLLSTNRLQDTKPSMWYAIDQEFNLSAPPEWSRETVDRMFIHVNNYTRPNLHTLVFSSMSSEFEGFPGTADESQSDISSFKELLNQVVFPQYKGLFERLIHFEDIRARKPAAWPARMKDWDLMLSALSTVRYACPQAWLIANWLINRTLYEEVGRTKFYHIIHQEAPRYSYSNIPAPPNSGNRRLPFHGLDMLILTGNYQNQPISFDSYRYHLWENFNNFVQGQPLSNLCEITPNPEADEPVAEVGCLMTSYGAHKAKLNFTVDSICRQIDWESHYYDLAMYE